MVVFRNDPIGGVLGMELGSNHPCLHVLATNHAYLQLRAEPNCEGSLRTLWQPPYDSCLITVHSYVGRVS
jgi:hypothetical protein